MLDRTPVNSLENRHLHGEERLFRLTARRNKLLGLWAAELLGMSGTAAAHYARDVVASDLDEPGDEDVIRKVLGDFRAHGLSIGDAEIRARLRQFEAEAQHGLE